MTKFKTLIGSEHEKCAKISKEGEKLPHNKSHEIIIVIVVFSEI